MTGKTVFEAWCEAVAAAEERDYCEVCGAWVVAAWLAEHDGLCAGCVERERDWARHQTAMALGDYE